MIVPATRHAAVVWSHPRTRARPSADHPSRTDFEAAKAAKGLQGRPSNTTPTASIQADFCVKGRASAAPHASAGATLRAQADQAAAAASGGHDEAE